MNERKHLNYRFKTRSEMHTFNGETWQDTIRFGWCAEMDQYLGKHIIELPFFIDKTTTDSEKLGYINEGCRTWTISFSMLVEEDPVGKNVIVAPITKEAIYRNKDTRNYLKGSDNGLEFIVLGTDEEINLINKKITLTINPISKEARITTFIVDTSATKEEFNSVNDLFKELFTQKVEIDDKFLTTPRFIVPLKEDASTIVFNYETMKHELDKTFF